MVLESTKVDLTLGKNLRTGPSDSEVFASIFPPQTKAAEVRHPQCGYNRTRYVRREL